MDYDPYDNQDQLDLSTLVTQPRQKKVVVHHHYENQNDDNSIPIQYYQDPGQATVIYQPAQTGNIIYLDSNQISSDSNIIYYQP